MTDLSVNVCPIPKLTDKYIIISYNDGTSLLIKKSKQCNDELECCSVVKSGKISYADLTTGVTQRAYDYHFYFGNFIATNTSNTIPYQLALAQLMDVFSKKLTSYIVANSGVVSYNFTTWDQVHAFQQEINGPYFMGWTSHNMPNVRVRPVLNSRTIQASCQSHLIEYSFVATITGPNYINGVSNYNFTWAYEDGVWRIITFYVDNRISLVLPTPYLLATPYVPAKNVC